MLGSYHGLRQGVRSSFNLSGLVLEIGCLCTGSEQTLELKIRSFEFNSFVNGAKSSGRKSCFSCCVPDLLIGFFLHVDKDRSDISHFCICTCIFKKSRNETKCGAKINYIITINSSTWIQIHSIQTRVISQLLEFPGIHVTQICQERSNV